MIRARQLACLVGVYRCRQSDLCVCVAGAFWSHHTAICDQTKRSTVEEEAYQLTCLPSVAAAPCCVSLTLQKLVCISGVIQSTFAANSPTTVDVLCYGLPAQCRDIHLTRATIQSLDRLVIQAGLP